MARFRVVSDLPLLHFWYSALRTEFGIVVEFDPEERNKMLQALYKARADAMDPELDSLGITQSPAEPNHFWIVRKNAVS